MKVRLFAALREVASASVLDVDAPSVGALLEHLSATYGTAFDRIMNRRHGESYRRKIRSTAAFGFLTAGEWRWLFRGMGLEPEAHPLSRFCRSILQPFARTAFVLRKSRALVPA